MDSGVYTPTLTSVLNIGSVTARACQWFRVGDVVTVSGSLDVDPVAPGLTKVDISLPVATTMTANQQCSGVANTQLGDTAAIIGTATDARLNWTATPTTSRTFYFTFTYLVQ